LVTPPYETVSEDVNFDVGEWFLTTFNPDFNNLQFQLQFKTETTIPRGDELVLLDEEYGPISFTATNLRGQFIANQTWSLFMMDVKIDTTMTNNILDEDEEQKEEQKEKEIDCQIETKQGLGCIGILRNFVLRSECKHFCRDSMNEAVRNLFNILTYNNVFGQDKTGSSYELGNVWRIVVVNVSNEAIFKASNDDELEEPGSEMVKYIDFSSAKWLKVTITFMKKQHRRGLVKVFVQMPDENIQLTGFEEDEEPIRIFIRNPLHLSMESPD
jgi:hypothetical protein